MANFAHKVELVTVSSMDFLPGTQVMLDSFLRHNPWFSGQITVIHDDLDRQSIENLERDFRGLRCQQPTQELLHALTKLVDARPELASRKRRFYSLDLFGGSASSGAIFVDSDVLFRASVESVFDACDTIAACGDRALLAGGGRDPETLEELTEASAPKDFRSFNAGFLVVQPKLRAPETYDRLLADLTPERWASLRSDHTDQAVLNRCFGREVAILHPEYNWMIGHAARLAQGGFVLSKEPKVLHFNGISKPWRLGLDTAGMAHESGFAAALKEWHLAYRRFLARRKT